MSVLSFEAQSEEETAALAAAVAERLPRGAIVALDGPLGAGKTRFVQGVARALGVPPGEVASPTYTLIHEYAGRRPVYHFDAYRIASADEFLELGADEYFAGEGIALIEWAQRVQECLPPERLEVRIAVTGPTSRRFDFTPHGDEYERLVAELRAWAASHPTGLAPPA